MCLYIKVSKFLLFIIAALLSNGCQYKGIALPYLPYSENIEQGRLINIKLLRDGLTSDQIKLLIGEPIFIKENTWEYFYYYKESNKEPSVTKLVLQFVDNKLKKWYKKP